MKQILIVVLCIPLCICAQEKGIQFEQNLNWQQIFTKARQENKYIFIDCSASWCGPCKMMDKDIYPSERLGEYMNTRFISVKVQLDTANQDNDQIKSWYRDAHIIKEQFKIAAFPTFLFFSPDGKIVHRGLGYKEVNDFFMLITNATNPNGQYYTLLKNYQQGKKNYPLMPYLVDITRMIDDETMANMIARDYINNYLMKLKEEQLYTKKNIEFIGLFIQSSKDNDFRLIYHHGTKVDEIMGIKDYSQNLVDYIIEKEDVNPKIWRDINNSIPVSHKPNWITLFSSIKIKYNSYNANRAILSAKIRWLEYIKDWPKYCKNVIKKVEMYGPYEKHFPYASLFSMEGKLNANAWDLFQYSSNNAELAKALSWSDSSIKIIPKPNAEYFDTYANLLYKIGRIQEAIAWEENAVRLDPNAKDIQGNLEKMKMRKPTWPVK